MPTDTDVRSDVTAARWDLSCLFESDAEALSAMEFLNSDASGFQARERGRIAGYAHGGAEGGARFAAAVGQLAQLKERLANVTGYAALRTYQATGDQDAKDLLARITTLESEVQDHLRFFALEWSALSDEDAARLTDHQELADLRHWLLKGRRFRPYLLGEAEERALAQRDEAADACWQNLHQGIISRLGIKVLLPGAPRRTSIGFGQALGMVKHPSPRVRRSMIQGLAEALEPEIETLAQCYDSRVCDRLAIDRIRGYLTPIAATNLANELPDELVQSLLTSVSSRYGVAQEWFHAKAAHTGSNRLHLADLYAPVGAGDLTVEWSEALEFVNRSFDGFSPDAGRIVRGLLNDGRIDAGLRRDKRPGAFCAPVGASHRPFIMLAFDGGLRQVSTLAHELGHGVHRTMSAQQRTALDYGIGIEVAEIPSTFFELVFRDVALARVEDPAQRVTLSCSLLEDTFAIVFRQTQMALFEQRAYSARAAGEQLSAARLSEYWLDGNREYFGGAVEMPEGAQLGWSYIPHFIVARFYTYAYSFAYLCAASLHARWRQDPERMSVLISDELLCRGGSRSPAQILSALGFDLSDSAIWNEGLDAIAGAVAQAKRDLTKLS
ncbi:M3 family metallopeptidase [Miltoncostaea oceani]|uniref:M3 family metallopeptidase n=1 Tax=Miltoncostaea oceani TaxID=2843216 RepID=UPI001C3DBA2C|nr:M3 family metallopeptidase [Miltoncostaea oceani]